MSGGHDNLKRMGKGDLLTEDADVGLGHIVPLTTYRNVFATLIGLTLLTVAVASVDLWVFNLVIAIAIATVKAGLVTLFFMHLNWEKKIIWVIVIYPIFVFLLILAGTLGDTMLKMKPHPALDAVVESQGAPVSHAVAGITDPE